MILVFEGLFFEIVRFVFMPPSDMGPLSPLGVSLLDVRYF